MAILAGCEGQLTDPVTVLRRGSIADTVSRVVPIFLPLAGPGRIYAFAEPIPPGQVIDETTRRSRYVLYDDMTLAVQFPHQTQFIGWYVRTGERLTLRWARDPSAPPVPPYPESSIWEATATLVRDTLRVSYNAWMSLSDFVDASYVGR